MIVCWLLIFVISERLSVLICYFSFLYCWYIQLVFFLRRLAITVDISFMTIQIFHVVVIPDKLICLRTFDMIDMWLILILIGVNCLVDRDQLRRYLVNILVLISTGHREPFLIHIACCVQT